MTGPAEHIYDGQLPAMKDAIQAAEKPNVTSLNDSEPQKPSAEGVRAYLIENPQFFSHYPELLEKLVIPHEQLGKRFVS